MNVAGMNVAVMKTKAELALIEGFQAVSARLPGGPAMAEARAEAMARFSEQGLPHRRIEAWKYTDLRASVREVAPAAVGDAARLTVADVIVALGPFYRLDAPRLVLVNGAFRKELSSFARLSGVEVTTLGATLSASADPVGLGLAATAAAERNAVLSLNTAMMTDGAMVTVAPGAVVEQPLLIVSLRAGPEPRLATTRHVVKVGAGARMTIIEAHLWLQGSVVEGQVNAASEIEVGDGAELTLVKCIADAGAVTHLANWGVRIGEAATLRAFQLTTGAGLARNQTHVAFEGEGGKLDFSGILLGRGSEHVDTTLVVDHKVPHCESRELFHAVLDGEAKGVFQGKVIVRPGAQKTDGKQMAKALMLSPDAEFDSKPELEIYADDVVCGHGATVAELDEDLMFYCQSRGIPAPEARALLIEAFVAEVLEKVQSETLRETLAEIARGGLSGPGATR